MKTSMPTGRGGPYCACPQPLTAQLRQPSPATQLCVASPLGEAQPPIPPSKAGTSEHSAQASTGSLDYHPDTKALPRKLCVQLPHTEYPAGRVLFRQGDPADTIFYVGSGRLHRSITTEKGDDRIVSILSAGDFCGEECLTGQSYRTTSAIVVQDAQIGRIDKGSMLRLLREWPDLSSAFTTYLVAHSLETESALIDQLVGSVEQRLRRVLLKLANMGEVDRRQVGTISNIKQETLASIVGTTRPRVNYLMNKFRKLGWIDYRRTSNCGRILVHARLRCLGENDSERFGA